MGPMKAYVLVVLAGMAAACRTPLPTTQAAAPLESRAASREIRITGLVQAVHSVKLLVPQIQGQVSMMTLTQLIPNGAQVREGDLIATFDPTQQMDAAREAQAKYEDLGHQVEQKAAENRANVEKRLVDMKQAEGDLAKAELELEKREVLSDIDKKQAETRAAGAKLRVASLKKSMEYRQRGEAAALRILELQRDRQKIAMERARGNLNKLELRSPLAGMAVHELTRRANTMGKAQAGDQMYRGYPLVSIFNPSEMEVVCSTNEPDLVSLLNGRTASVSLDAYPELELPATFVSASPVASSPLDTPIKTFVTKFRIGRPDPHLLPDLSASVVVMLPEAAAKAGEAKK
jgi:HlyD family secretion protein